MKKTTTLLLILLLCPLVLHAGEYFGFKPGEQTHAEVAVLLESKDAGFEVDYGYRGYAEDLPVIKVNHYPTFSKFGSVKEAWLSFAPDRTLYKIDVTWADAGGTYKTLKDGLDIKYGRPDASGRGFEQSLTYRDGQVEITLHRNTFGFGADQSTALTYRYLPAVSAVEEMRARIEAHIKQKNASKAAGDL